MRVTVLLKQFTGNPRMKKLMGIIFRSIMDPNMKQLQEALVDIETDAEQVLLARHQVHLCDWIALLIPDESLNINHSSDLLFSVTVSWWKMIR